jgi:hypothetical protein
MPTQEERLQTLEYGLKQFKTETIKAYGEVAIELIMVKGLTEDAVKRLASLGMQVEQVDQRFVNLNQQITGIQQEISGLKDLLLQVLARLPERSS